MLNIELLREALESLRILRFTQQELRRLLDATKQPGPQNDHTISPSLWAACEGLERELVLAVSALDVALLSQKLLGVSSTLPLSRFVPAAPGVAGDELPRAGEVLPGPDLQAPRELEFDATGALRAPRRRPKRIAPGETEPRPVPPPLTRPRKR